MDTKENIIKNINLHSYALQLEYCQPKYLFSLVADSTVIDSTDDSLNVETKGLSVTGICSPICDTIYSNISNNDVDTNYIKDTYNCDTICANICDSICDTVCTKIW